MSDGPVLLVTGGSRGIGAAVALAAASEGWRVAVNYASNRDAAEDVVRRIAEAGGTAVSVEGNVGREEGVRAIFAAVDTAFGRLDGLVNNAGIIGPPQRVDEVSPERIEQLFRVNVTGSIRCAAEAVLRMSARHGGRGGSIVKSPPCSVRPGNMSTTPPRRARSTASRSDWRVKSPPRAYA